MTERHVSTQRTPGAVIYTRVSTGEQDKHGTSPETQRDACRIKALEMSLPIMAEYYDSGISGGFLLARREFQAALADIREGRADTLICPNISRYSRDVEHQQAVKKAVKAAGGHLVFCDMEFADTPEGDLNFTIQGGFAEYERKVIRQRTMKGKRKRAEEGRQMSPSRSPFGYHIVLKADILRGDFPAEMLGRYVVDESQAPVIRELFTRYASGECGTPALAQDFNSRGIPPPRGGRLWRCSSLRCLLRNPAYKGQPAYGRFAYHTDENRLLEVNKLNGQPRKDITLRLPAPEGYTVALVAPALVPEALWEAAQQRMTTNRGQISGNPRRARMLSGRIFCPCGHKATCRASGVQAGGRTSPDNYQCSQARNAQMWTGKEARACSLELFRISISESAVSRAILSAANEPNSLRDAHRAFQAKQERQIKLTSGISGIRAELSALDTALAEIAQEDLLAVQAQIAGMRSGASPSAYGAVFAELASRRKDMEDQRGQIARRLAQTSETQKRHPTEPSPQAAPDSLDQRALEAAALVLSAPDVPGETKRRLISLVIEKVVCQKNGADIYFLPGFGVGTEQTWHSEQALEWLDADQA